MIVLNTEYSRSQAQQGSKDHHHDHLRFSFPDVHIDAHFDLEFQRTLRIPDDGTDHPLPPGLGCFPLRHVDDFADRVPADWREHGGVMLPMFQSEAMWINFTSKTQYPFLVKIAAGKINAITGDPWHRQPKPDPQDYLVIPKQPWLDGFCIEKGVIRQFVAAPLGTGYSVEEQISGQAAYGGLQIVAYPLRAKQWEINKCVQVVYVPDDISYRKIEHVPDMGLAAGGRMKQSIYDDPYIFSHWDLEHGSRCFVHLTNSLSWQFITGEEPPTLPPTAKHYATQGLPWFEYYSETPSVEGSNILKDVKSVVALDQEKAQGEGLLPENESTGDVQIEKLGNKEGIVREF